MAQSTFTPSKDLEVIILVGIPGSGKSTWISKQNLPYQTISTDQIRKELTGKVEDQSQNEQVFQLAYERLGHHLNHQMSVIFDATNTQKIWRGRIIEIAKQYDAFTTIVEIEDEVEIFLQRNRKRPSPVPEDVMQEQMDEFEKPTLEEVDRIFIVDAFGKPKAP